MIFRIEGCPDAVAPLSAAMQRPGSDLLTPSGTSSMVLVPPGEARAGR